MPGQAPGFLFNWQRFRILRRIALAIEADTGQVNKAMKAYDPDIHRDRSPSVTAALPAAVHRTPLEECPNYSYGAAQSHGGPAGGEAMRKPVPPFIFHIRS